MQDSAKVAIVVHVEVSRIYAPPETDEHPQRPLDVKGPLFV